MKAIFVSYRRGDYSRTDFIADTLGKAFPDRVFLDADRIDSGDDWPNKLQTALEDCDALVAVIGSSWVKRCEDLTKETDWVRRELLAFEDRPVLPVLVDDVDPGELDLPPELKWLTGRIQAHELSRRGAEDVEGLVDWVRANIAPDLRPHVERAGEPSLAYYETVRAAQPRGILTEMFVMPRLRSPSGEGGFESVAEALASSRRLLLTGGQGQGKTTLLRYIGACAAGQRLGKKDLSHAQLGFEEGDAASLGIPVLVPVDEIIGEVPKGGSFRATLDEFIERQLGKERARLHEGGVLLLVDGLDDASKWPDRVAEVRRAILAVGEKLAHAEARPSHMIVCVQSDDSFPEEWVGVKPVFGESEIRLFFYRWDISDGTVETSVVHDLFRAVRDINGVGGFSNPLRRVPADLTATPLHLTLLCAAHARGADLLAGSEQLYGDTVTALLEHWLHGGPEDSREHHPERVLWRSEIGAEGLDRVRRQLGRFALDLYRRELGESAMVELSHLLVDEFGEHYAAAKKALTEGSGLLTSVSSPQRKDDYRFTQKAFRDHLAAIGLTDVEADLDGETVDEIVQRALDEPEDWADLTVSAALVAAAQGGAAFTWTLAALRFLLGSGDPLGYLMACNVLARLPNRARGKSHDRLVSEATEGLAESIGQLSLPHRSLAGDLLGELGDPRFSGPFELAADPLGGFVPVTVEDAPVSAPDLDPAFYIGRHPVTVAQYDHFSPVDSDERVQRWRRGGRTYPVDFVDVANAEAYCAWLTDRLPEAAGAIEVERLRALGWRCRLPTDAEWLRAAGCDGPPLEAPEGWAWTKGLPDVAELLSVNRAVGLSPELASVPFGVEDLAGAGLELIAPPDGVATRMVHLRGSYPGGQTAAAGPCFGEGLQGAHQIDRFVGFRVVFGPALQHRRSGS